MGQWKKSVMEQEVVYVALADPETRKPILVFFEVVAPSESQHALGLKKAIINKCVIERIAFLSSDGALVNCRKYSGLSDYFKRITLGYHLSCALVIGLSWP